MSSDVVSQAHSGIYSQKSLPDFQGAMMHLSTHWRRLVSLTMSEVIEAIIFRTARMRRRHATIQKQWFLDGHHTDNENYAGCPPVNVGTIRALNKAIRALMDLGIIREIRKDTYVINYAVVALDIVEDEDVQKRVLHENRRGGLLSTLDGIYEWAAALVRFTIPEPPSDTPTDDETAANVDMLELQSPSDERAEALQSIISGGTYRFPTSNTASNSPYSRITEYGKRAWITFKMLRITYGNVDRDRE